MTPRDSSRHRSVLKHRGFPNRFESGVGKDSWTAELLGFRDILTGVTGEREHDFNHA